MFKVCGNTNYECTCAEEQVFGFNLDIESAFNLFLKLLEDKNSLDFTEMDAEVDDWAEAGDWTEEDYYWGSYGGTIAVYEEATEPNEFDREIVVIRVERDPLHKTNEYGKIEFGPEILPLEKELFLALR